MLLFLLSPQKGSTRNPDFSGFASLCPCACACAGKFVVVPADRSLCGSASSTTLIPKKLWSIVREHNDNKHILQEGDVIKLGRFKLRVKQLVTKRKDDGSNSSTNSSGGGGSGGGSGGGDGGGGSGGGGGGGTAAVAGGGGGGLDSNQSGGGGLSEDGELKLEDGEPPVSKAAPE